MTARLTIPVWSPSIRICHWLLAALIGASWCTRHGGGTWHEYLGYGAAAVVALRIALGMFGSGHARFAAFVVGPRALLSHLRTLRARHAAHFIGHNPAGGYMVLVLLAATASVSATGWLYTTDRYWGVEWVERLHACASDLLLLLILVHLCGVAFESWRGRENLVTAMLHGHKRMPAHDPAHAETDIHPSLKETST